MLRTFKFCTEFTTTQFLKLSNLQLSSLNDKIENFENVETSFSDGVLNVHLPNGKSFVINRQTPNKQLWYSSPISGPQRFNYVNGKWVNSKQEEIEKQLLNEINLLIQ
ncbi:unnamed protein product (macronuclear) [Paramecium tetraurelia]|uniref:Ferroxidase n=1 Tax=Paramecium tetraurelia TaxID=5888 RepID=A0EA90_PARTE|nr:uncharacterized protein GSPATT00024939001 [Paramecium tetraurelia]CAK92207.1 unnamed protein product [Paramecium tetraurelia]|eukprot:XP_001459604.1 hypothetical protein (macronuclear) [Paramecium tetraurelia strain d4-2]